MEQKFRNPNQFSNVTAIPNTPGTKRHGISLSMVPCTHAFHQKVTMTDTPIKQLKDMKTNFQQRERYNINNTNGNDTTIIYQKHNKSLNIDPQMTPTRINGLQGSLKKQNEQLRDKINEIMKILNQERQKYLILSKGNKQNEQQLDIYKTKIKQYQQKYQDLIQQNQLLREQLKQTNSNIQKWKNLEKALEDKQQQFSVVKQQKQQIQNLLKSKDDEIRNYKWILDKIRGQEQKTAKKRPQSIHLNKNDSLQITNPKILIKKRSETIPIPKIDLRKEIESILIEKRQSKEKQQPSNDNQSKKGIFMNLTRNNLKRMSNGNNSAISNFNYQRVISATNR